MAAHIQKDTARLVLNESIVSACESNDGIGNLTRELVGFRTRCGRNRILDVRHRNRRDDDRCGVGEVQRLDGPGREGIGLSQLDGLLHFALVGQDREFQFIFRLGFERLDGDIELGGSAGGDSLISRDRERRCLGNILVTAALETGRVAGEVDIVGADNVHGGGEGNRTDRQRLVRVIGQIDRHDGGEMLHGHNGYILDGDILDNAVHGKIRSGQMGHAAGTGLSLAAVGGGADCQITVGRVRGCLNVAAVRIEQIPVIRLGREFGGAGGVARIGVVHFELGVRGILRRTGDGIEDVQGVAVFPLGGHAGVDGPGVDVAEDNPDGHAVETADVGLLVTADKRKGGRSQTRKEKGLFHRAVL